MSTTTTKPYKNPVNPELRLEPRALCKLMCSHSAKSPDLPLKWKTGAIEELVLTHISLNSKACVKITFFPMIQMTEYITYTVSINTNPAGWLSPGYSSGRAWWRMCVQGLHDQYSGSQACALDSLWEEEGLCGSWDGASFRRDLIFRSRISGPTFCCN